MRLNATRLGSIASSRSFGDQLDDLAGQVPGLDLNFAQNKSLIDDYSGTTLVTFTRASTGTFVGSNGLIQTAATNEARFTHDPTTGESLGLLVEEARTNLLLQSEDLATTWTPGTGTVITTNTWTAPDGTLTGDQFTVGTVSTAPSQNVTVAASSSYTLSFYLNTLLTTSAFLRLRFSTLAGSTSAFFNVSTLAFGTLNAITNPTVQRVGTNIYKLSVTFTYDATSAGSRAVAIGSVTTDNGATPDTGKIVAIWGMQYELGAFATSYIPTTTATVTRAADVASITGANFSSWYNQTEGSFFCSTTAPKGTVVFGTGDTFDNTQYVTVAASNNVSIRSGGSDQAVLSAAVSSSANTNVAFGYALNSFAAVSNGGTISTDTAGNVPAAQIRLKIGSTAWDTGGGNNVNGTIKRLTYWPTRLANTTLQQITQP
jgi:hypothetical protein